ncbi:prolyl-tRNA editing enzyme YbaK/EbsC (Cys-tRNA(Pro) deacylase) [Cytobacillus firmus]|uniref:Prolyl-tRNA editing enzyme YbaK/EbsC (Cys-tRNA(Pro) deacylase) n=2 Tax=Cytobacillus TaxID=2675230 RepID=A0A366JNA2_CYTFI|nr:MULTISPECIES: YbaK/EbsC family protein [Cytobacillus]RBP87820.1 prolyl-tRNA editing enzyme YbaK/EbsC (Cys-tRNA(Pro) deacylase) [Cytobacillus firmus]TDX39182.1 prolyl-tRNA editing enzyme YbaK/EbsC (Cys-tRNA(Pro) deacylase) [Cytobacillus oceanisediminis]
MNKLQGILERCEYKYEIIQHEKPILSREEGSKYFRIEVGQTAPTLILKTDKGYFVLIVSGDRDKLDYEKIAIILGCSKVKLASPKEVQKVTGFEVGSVPMVGLDISCVLDKRIFEYDFIYGGTGKSTFTLKIEPQALNELNQVVATLD